MPAVNTLTPISSSTALSPSASPWGSSFIPGTAACRCGSGLASDPMAPFLQQQMAMSNLMMLFLQVMTRLMLGGKGRKAGGIDPLSALGRGNGSRHAGGTGGDGHVRANRGAARPVGIQQASSSGRSLKGLDPVASDALRRAGLGEADVSQGLGDAAASAGTHLAEPGSRYTASVDIRTSGRSSGEIRKIVSDLRAQGFAAWYRNWPGNQHIHAVYAGVPLKSSTSQQVQAFLHGGTGLAGGGSDSSISAQDRESIRALYEDRNRRVSVET